VSLGTSPPYSSLSMMQHSTIAFAFCLGNPAGLTSSATSSTSAAAMASTESYLRNRLSDALRVLSSLVRCESIVAMRTWKGSGGHSGFRPSEFLPGKHPWKYSPARMSSIVQISSEAISAPPPPS